MEKEKKSTITTKETSKQRKRKYEATTNQEKLTLKSPDRPVRRKLCFDCVEDESNKQNSPSDNMKMPNKSTFNIELENLLNSSFEENRKRCIQKYNFDPVLEKPLEGKFVWEKVVD